MAMSKKLMRLTGFDTYFAGAASPNIISLIWLPLMHIGAIAALFNYSAANFWAFAVLYFATGCLGITLTYHRLLAHRTFALPLWLERILATFGGLALQGGPARWVAHHRMHHAGADTDHDPHDSRRGFFYCHVGWALLIKPEFDCPDRLKKFARDVHKDPYYRWLDTAAGMIIPQALLVALLYAIGGFSMVLWGLCLRMTVVYNATWLVNSATHFFGYKNYTVDDRSRNTWWVALVTFGEGWHNNHHAYPNVVEAGHKWWEFDATMVVVRFLRAAGLATKVRSIRQRQKSANVAPAGAMIEAG